MKRVYSDSAHDVAKAKRVLPLTASGTISMGAINICNGTVEHPNYTACTDADVALTGAQCMDSFLYWGTLGAGRTATLASAANIVAAFTAAGTYTDVLRDILRSAWRDWGICSHSARQHWRNVRHWRGQFCRSAVWDCHPESSGHRPGCHPRHIWIRTEWSHLMRA
jgi:hypothetical protein